MKILFLLRFFPVYGGGETVTIKLANKLVEHGYDVGIFFIWDKTRENPPFVDKRIKQFKANNIEPPVRVDNYKKSAAKQIKKELSRVIANFAPDIIINQWYPTKMVSKANNASAKIITCLHSTVIEPLFKDSFRQKLVCKILGDRNGKKWQAFKRSLRLRKNYKYSDKYVLLSERFTSDFYELTKLKDEGKVLGINNPAFFDSWIEENALENKENVVLFVGRFGQEKRINLILFSWHLLPQELKKNWKLVLCGDGVLWQEMIDYAKSLNLENIEFLGQCNPAESYKKAKIFLMTSLFEGFCMTLVECQQFGCIPIVMDSFRALHDIVIDGQNGFITPNNEIEVFTEKLKGIMENNTKLHEMAKNAISYSKRFDVENIIAQWENLFKEMVV